MARTTAWPSSVRRAVTIWKPSRLAADFRDAVRPWPPCKRFALGGPAGRPARRRRDRCGERPCRRPRPSWRRPPPRTIDECFRSQGGQGRMEESALGAERLDDAAAVGGVGQIAAGAAGKEDFRSRLGPFFQQERFPAALGRTARRHQPRRSPAHDHHIPRRHKGIIHEGTIFRESVGGTAGKGLRWCATGFASALGLLDAPSCCA